MKIIKTQPTILQHKILAFFAIKVLWKKPKQISFLESLIILVNSKSFMICHFAADLKKNYARSDQTGSELNFEIIEPIGILVVFFLLVNCETILWCRNENLFPWIVHIGLGKVAELRFLCHFIVSRLLRKLVITWA